MATSALAADDPPTLPTITVIGSTPLPGVGLSKDQIAAPVQTGTAAQIERSNSIDLPGYLLRFLDSVYVNDIQNNPFQPDINYRGFTASPLLGTPQGLSVYMDGVRLNQPFGVVVSWDLIPRSAISSFDLMPGSNPMFGLNTLGGALSIQTKDGVSNPGTSLEAYGGQNARWSAEFETGGSKDTGLNWFFTGNYFKENGWRDASPSRVGQLFGKVGWQDSKTKLSLTGAYADTDLTGNGLQEQRFLARDYASVYTIPDNTKNKSVFVNLLGQHNFSDDLAFSGNAYYRNIKTATSNGDINDDSLEESVYQPNASEQAALTAAGYTGFPTSGENASNTPFPFWRCIANSLLNTEPNEKCNGLLNTTNTNQQNYGLSGQLTWNANVMGNPNQLTGGLAYDASTVHFTQGTQYGYLNPDRSITTVGSFADGTQDSENASDNRVDLNGRTYTTSVYATDTLTLARRPGTSRYRVAITTRRSRIPTTSYRLAHPVHSTATAVIPDSIPPSASPTRRRSPSRPTSDTTKAAARRRPLKSDAPIPPIPASCPTPALAGDPAAEASRRQDVRGRHPRRCHGKLAVESGCLPHRESRRHHLRRRQSSRVRLLQEFWRDPPSRHRSRPQRSGRHHELWPQLHVSRSHLSEQ